MDCESVREQMADGEVVESIAAHLERCASCRAETELGRRMAAAVATLPRVSAPEGLVVQVMAELRSLAPIRQTSPRLPRLRLWPWEAGWLVALGLSMLIGAWVVGGGAAGTPWQAARMSLRDAAEWLQASVRDLLPVVPLRAPDLGAALRFVRETMAAVSGIPLSWLLGLIGFGIGLVWLLSRHGEIGPRVDWEDAHA